MKRVTVAAICVAVPAAVFGGVWASQNVHIHWHGEVLTAAPYSTCRIFNRGTLEMLDVGGPGADDQCQKIAAEFSKRGDFWSLIGTAPTDDTIVCSETKDNIEIDVWDGGGQMLGTAQCSHLQAIGWTQIA